jgi:hypothetical protein
MCLGIRWWPVHISLTFQVKNGMAYFMNNCIELFLWPEGEPMKHCLSECASGRLQLWLCPVHASHITVVMSAISILSVANNNTRVQE